MCLVPNVPENLKKFFKQIQKLYERDTQFQTELDNIIENSQVCVHIFVFDYFQNIKLKKKQ